MSEGTDAVERAYCLNIGRAVGRTGRRRLKLSIANEAAVQQLLFLSQHWTCQSNRVLSRVTIEQGSPLAGTHVDLVEMVGVTALEVAVQIPGSSRVFSPPFPFQTYIFGSEFAYEDFRFFLPPGSVQANGSSLELGWQVRYSDCVVTHYFNNSLPIPIKSVWSRLPSMQCFREIVVDDFQEFSGIVMPKVMRASQIGTKFVSCMTLEDISIG